MKKNAIFTIVAILAILGVGIAIKFSQNSTNSNSDEKSIVSNSNAENSAASIGEGEVRITNENFQSEVRDFKGVVMVDIFSPTCSHCQKMGPIVSEIAREQQGKAKVGKLNVLVSPEIASEFKIESVPAFIFFKDGKEVARIIGETPKEDLLSKLQELSTQL